MQHPDPIDRKRMFEPLLEADPSFGPCWRSFVADWAEEGEREMPMYLALADLARHLIAKLEQGETTAFPAIFTVIEAWHLNGDAYVREAATVGLLESLQNGGLHNRTRPSDLVPWLGPESRRWWEKLERFWSHREPIKDD